jgi:hypothetical protein
VLEGDAEGEKVYEFCAITFASGFVSPEFNIH